MRVLVRGTKYTIPNSHAYAQAIESLARTYALGGDGRGRLPERNDVKQLWSELRQEHRTMLVEIAIRPGGIGQKDLQGALRVDYKGLRGIHNGLARICERLEVEKPVHTMGYNSENRRYDMPQDVAATIRRLAKR